MDDKQNDNDQPERLRVPPRKIQPLESAQDLQAIAKNESDKQEKTREQFMTTDEFLKRHEEEAEGKIAEIEEEVAEEIEPEQETGPMQEAILEQLGETKNEEVMPTTQGIEQAKSPEKVQDSSAKKSNKKIVIPIIAGIIVLLAACGIGLFFLL